MSAQKLHIEIGHQATHNIYSLDDANIRFVTDDGRTLFEVGAADDGKSIIVYGISRAVIDGVPHSPRLAICPRSANSIAVSLVPESQKPQ